jgi:hypothetical protein
MSAQDQLLIGPARLYVAASGTSIDAEDAAAFAVGEVPVGWTYLGDTTKETTLKDNPSYARAMSQQTNRVLEIAVTEISTTITTGLREIDANKLTAFVRGTNVGGAVAPGGIGPVPKIALVLVGPWPGGNAVFAAERAAYIGERSVSWNAEDFTSVDIEVEVLENADGQPFVIYLND